MPEGAVVYSDIAYATAFGMANEYLTEDLLQEAASITLRPICKANSTRQLEAFEEYV